MIDLEFAPEIFIQENLSMIGREGGGKEHKSPDGTFTQ